MLCDECQKRPARVHLTKIVNQEKTETHLCDECARKRSDQFLIEPSFTFHNILSGLFEPESVGVPVAQKQAVQRMRCTNCGLTFADFRRLGHLGCSHCYDQFERQLEPLLRRIHGATRHTGRAPRRAAGHLRMRRELQRLREELAQAIAKEEYERAAELRDQIRQLQEKVNG